MLVLSYMMPTSSSTRQCYQVRSAILGALPKWRSCGAKKHDSIRSRYRRQPSPRHVTGSTSRNGGVREGADGDDSN